MAEFDANKWASDLQAKGEAAERESVWQRIADKQAADDYGVFGSEEAALKAGSWLAKLPKNLSVSALNAALAMGGLLDDIGGVISGQNLKVKDEKGNVSQATTGRPVAQVQPDGSVERMPALPSFVLDPVAKWRDEVTRNNLIEDDITQGVAQFVIPFTMYAKAANVSKAKGLLDAAARIGGAEAAAVGTAFEPHDARGADLLELGRNAENKFGDVMRRVSPDGSLMNSYINYMVDREDESPWEGRFKNIVDSLALSGATAGLLKAVPFSMKAARYAAENAGTGPAFGSRAAQGGWVGYHGTPHSFDKFDVSKIGTGEGEQAYGHGLYFAENKDVAQTYRGAGDIVHQLASASLYKHKGDWQKAVADLRSRGDNRSAAAARKLEQAKGKLSGGNLYTVEIPDDVVAKMLDYDKPLGQQPEVLAKIKAAGYGYLFEDGPGRSARDPAVFTGGEFLRRISENADRVQLSEDLSAAGIPGVRYLDGMSRPQGEGTRNVVLFDDKHVKIKGKE